MKRRNFLATLGGGTILAAGAATSALVISSEPTKAIAPWAQAGTAYREPRKRALSYAILAPNPHNRQPWLVDLSRPDEITLFVDTERLLPHTDPFSRQITIGLGCFLELLRMAAAEDGYRVEIDRFPMGFDRSRLDKRAIAKIAFHKDPNVLKDPLFVNVLDRRSLKEPYDLNHKVSDEVLRGLSEVVQNDVNVGTTNDADRLTQLRALTHDAFAIEIETPRTYKESVDLFRIGKTEVETNPDGIDFSGPMFEVLGAVGFFSRAAALDRSSTAFRQGIDAVMANCDTAMGFVWLTTTSNTRNDQLNVGRDWLRVNLAAAKLGVGTQPMSQALQEYAEMTELNKRCHKLLAPNGGTVQMLGRLGYSDAAPPSPRWPLEHKIIKV